MIFIYLAWTHDEEFDEHEPDEKKSELLWAVLASYLPTGTLIMCTYFHVEIGPF
jgi:hypothetical protein